MPNIIERAQRKIRKHILTPRNIARIAEHTNPVLRSVAAALAAHQARDLTQEEAQRIDAIENLRDEMCRSTELLTFPDYGAGSPKESPRTANPVSPIMVTQTLGEACCNYSKPPDWARLLFLVIRALKPSNCVELGTCLGVSAAYQAAALDLNGSGQLVTLEGAAALASIASDNLHRLRLSHLASVVVGQFQETLPSILSRGRIDFAFIDGHHDEQATIAYYEKFLPCLADRAVLVFDDIAWSPGMMRAWQHIIDDSRVDVSLDLGDVGICLFGVGVKERYAFLVV